MSFKMHRVHVWYGEVDDSPGGVASKLADLADAGANLEYVYCQRLPDKPGMGMLYVAPIQLPGEVKAAQSVGLHETEIPIVMRLEGDNHAGLAHRLLSAWAHDKINIHGSTLTVMNGHFVGFVTFDTVDDANRAATILAKLGFEPPASPSITT